MIAAIIITVMRLKETTIIASANVHVFPNTIAAEIWRSRDSESPNFSCETEVAHGREICEPVRDGSRAIAPSRNGSAWTPRRRITLDKDRSNHDLTKRHSKARTAE
jgi:hypothetical protein